MNTSGSRLIFVPSVPFPPRLSIITMKNRGYPTSLKPEENLIRKFIGYTRAEVTSIIIVIECFKSLYRHS